MPSPDRVEYAETGQTGAEDAIVCVGRHAYHSERVGLDCPRRAVLPENDRHQVDAVADCIRGRMSLIEHHDDEMMMR